MYASSMCSLVIIGVPLCVTSNLWILGRPWGLRLSLQLATTCVHDREINTPNIQDYSLLKVIYVQICS